MGRRFPSPTRAARGGALVALLLATPATLVAGVVEARAERVDSPGLEIVRFRLAAGVIEVRLPADLEAGDTISGSLALTPAGRTDRQRSKGLAELREMTLEIGGLARPVDGRVFRGLTVCGQGSLALTCTTAHPGDLPAVAIRLRDRKGRLAAEAPVPVRRSAASSGEAFRYRPIAQAGGPIQIHGPFDGDFATTRLTIGGRPAQLVAESPRHLVAASPPAVLGATRIDLAEQGAEATGTFRNLGVRLDLGKRALVSGERTTLDLALSGLEGLQAPLPVSLVCLTPAYARLEGGVRQEITVHPTELLARGTYRWVGTAVGLEPGPVEIVLSLEGSRPERRLTPASP